MQTQTAIGIILLVAASAGAQDAVERPAITAAQVQRTFDAVAARRAQQALQLTDADHARFAPRLQALQEARRRHRVATNRILADLRRLTNPQAAASDEGAITERLRALREEQDRGTAELRRAHDAIDEVLDVRQQARFRVFEERMEQQKLDLLLRARQNAPRGRDGAGRR